MAHLPTTRLISAAMMVGVALGTCLTPRRAEVQTHAKHKTAGLRAVPKAAAVYACPMHPEVKAKRRGRCKKCGMDLRLVKPDSQPASAPAVDYDKPMPAGSRLPMPDVELLDQEGRKVRFYSDLVRDRVVVINFIFTTCTTICPPLGATFARVQKELGERNGRDVSFISISVDPVTDTPERLKAWGAKFHAGPSWVFVTGDKPQINELLRSIGGATASPQDHSPTVLIVDDTRGQWTRTYGLAPPSQLVKLITNAIEGRLNNQEAAR